MKSISVPFDSLKTGKDFKPYLIQCGIDDTHFETPLPVKLTLKGDKLFVTSTFLDVDHKYLGELQDDHWKLFKSAIADYSGGTRFLEVIDHYNNVVFSVMYQQTNVIQIKGYHWGRACATVSGPVEEGGMHLYYQPGPEIKDSIIKYARKLRHIAVSKFDSFELQ